MKKLFVSGIALLMWLSSVFAAYQPSMTEQKMVDTAWVALIQIVDMKHDGNYELLLGILKSFESKVAGDERKVWILDSLIALTMDKMWMMMDDDDDELMDDDSDDMMDDDDDDMMDEMMEYLVDLEHVAENNIRWIMFDGSETGQASSVNHDGITHVYAQFQNLPDAGANNFYEGRIVRMSWWLSVLSTGELEMKDGMYVNDWMASGDIADHTFYVLTLEPRDNDPAPADHILEAHVK